MTKMHLDEREIDADLVRILIKEQFPYWSHLSLRAVSSIGTDNALFRLGDEMLVRMPRIDWAVDNVQKEFHWLPQLGSSLSVSIPVPLAMGSADVNYPWPWAIYRWLEGQNPIVDQLQSVEHLIDDLAKFLKELHQVSIPNGPLSNRGSPLQNQDAETRHAILQLTNSIDVKTVTNLWKNALELPKWHGAPVWIHGDLSPGNLLVKQERLHAVIDFGCLGMGDPASDLIIAWNLLSKKERLLFRTRVQVDEATWLRGRARALSIALIQLPYYKNTNPGLASNAQYVINQILEEFYAEN